MFPNVCAAVVSDAPAIGRLLIAVWPEDEFTQENITRSLTHNQHASFIAVDRSKDNIVWVCGRLRDYGV